MKHVSCLFDFQLICIVVLNKSGLNLILKQGVLDMEQHTVCKARIHFEPGVVLQSSAFDFATWGSLFRILLQ
jgi:hypothetical protein